MWSVNTLQPGAADEMALDRHTWKPAGGFVWLWILLTFIWFAANSSLAPELIATGALIAAVLAYLLSRKSSVWRDVRFSPARLYHFVRYTGVFAVELVRANINMMRYVFARRIDINPGDCRDQDQVENARGPARARELDRADARLSGDRH